MDFTSTSELALGPWYESEQGLLLAPGPDVRNPRENSELNGDTAQRQFPRITKFLSVNQNKHVTVRKQVILDIALFFKIWFYMTKRAIKLDRLLSVGVVGRKARFNIIDGIPALGRSRASSFSGIPSNS